MSVSVPARRLMIYLGESDSWQGRSLYLSILDTLRKSGIAGATVTRAVAGFGAHSRIRTETLEVLSTDLPIVISVIDTPDNINYALALVTPMVREGLITVEDVEIVKYTHRYLQLLPADLPVLKVMTRDVTAVAATTSARRVVELLLGKMFKAVPVIDEERRVVGIISSDDLLREAGMPARLGVGERLEADDLREFLVQVSQVKTAGQIMTAPVVTAQDHETLGFAVRRMLERGLKRLPVVDSQGRLTGMLSRLDILRAVAGETVGQPEQTLRLQHGRTIGEIMSPKVPMVQVNDDLADIVQRLVQASTRYVIVKDEREAPIGIITDSDLVARVSPFLRRNILQSLAARVTGADVKRGQATARQLMSEKVLTAPPETMVIEAVNLMLREGRKRLVVVDEGGRPIGMVDRQALLAASLEQ